MAVARAQIQREGDERGLGEAGHPLLSETDPIRLTDIDRVLEDSASVAERESADPGVPVRVWRDELTVARDSLTYARSVLASDVGILRHCLASDAVEPAALVDELPRLVAGHPWGEEWSDDDCDGPTGTDDVDWEVCVRSDALMTAHLEMARADLSSTEDVTRILRQLESQLSDLSRRQDAVEGRLQQVRKAIVGQYETGAVTAHDWLG